MAKSPGQFPIMNEGDLLIMPELSRLGRSLSDALNALNKLTDKKVQVPWIRESLCTYDLIYLSFFIKHVMNLATEV